MSLKIILQIIFCFCFYFSLSQELNDYELESRKNADFLFNEIIKNQTKKSSPYILLSLGKQHYLVLIDRKSHYTQVRAELKDKEVDILYVKTIKKGNSVLKKAFDQSIYRKEFIGFESDFFKDGYENAWGSSTYFVMKDSLRNRYGESCLSFITKPNPLDQKVYAHLINELINSK